MSIGHYPLQKNCVNNLKVKSQQMLRPLDNLNNIDLQISKFTFLHLTNTLPFGNLSFSNRTNTLIADANIDYLLETKIFLIQ